MSTYDLTGLVAIVTGAARGLGREMALELATLGAHVVITASQDTPAYRETLAQIGPKGMGVISDAGDATAAADLVAQVMARFGRIDVLVNNAGRGMRLISETFNTEPTKFWQASPQAWTQIIQINLNGAFYLAHAVTPHMIAQGRGKIINISTSAQTMVRKGYAPYGPSKAGLEAASRVWAQDLMGTGVDVNVYLPGGAADTDLLPPSENKRGADGNLLPASIMRRAIGWLASSASDGVTGARFIAAKWLVDLPDAQASVLAQAEPVAQPAIM